MTSGSDTLPPCLVDINLHISGKNHKVKKS